MAEVPIENIIRKAKDQYNSGDMLAARQSCLQALAQNPGNPEALHLFGAVNYSGLRNPFREMLLLLKKISLDPQFVLDIGAYSGDWTRAFREVFPQAKVLMVEAQAQKEADMAKVERGFARNRLCHRVAWPGRAGSGSILPDEDPLRLRRVFRL
jgi:hypothetical protein